MEGSTGVWRGMSETRLKERSGGQVSKDCRVKVEVGGWDRRSCWNAMRWLRSKRRSISKLSISVGRCVDEVDAEPDQT